MNRLILWYVAVMFVAVRDSDIWDIQTLDLNKKGVVPQAVVAWTHVYRYFVCCERAADSIMLRDFAGACAAAGTAKDEILRLTHALRIPGIKLRNISDSLVWEWIAYYLKCLFAAGSCWAIETKNDAGVVQFCGLRWNRSAFAPSAYPALFGLTWPMPGKGQTIVVGPASLMSHGDGAELHSQHTIPECLEAGAKGCRSFIPMCGNVAGCAAVANFGRVLDREVKDVIPVRPHRWEVKADGKTNKRLADGPDPPIKRIKSAVDRLLYVNYPPVNPYGFLTPFNESLRKVVEEHYLLADRLSVRTVTGCGKPRLRGGESSWKTIITELRNAERNKRAVDFGFSAGDKLEEFVIPANDPRVGLRGGKGVRVVPGGQIRKEEFVLTYGGILAFSRGRTTGIAQEFEFELYALTTQSTCPVNKCPFVISAPKGYGNLSRLINDFRVLGAKEQTTQPNVMFGEVLVNGRIPVPVITAVRDIAAGEELLIDYGEDYWRDFDARVAEGGRISGIVEEIAKMEDVA
ncbi:MAG: hypothetical protein KGL39_01140 [Patescibacteria group bacterium]|nr:hypothetical protein [Patescibacteria group bacterium]